VSTGTAIVAVSARQVYSDRGHPGVEAMVTTASGAQGVAVCTTKRQSHTPGKAGGLVN